MSKARIMFNMTVSEVRNGLEENKTVIVPIGVVEQHGYHLPLSVDIHNAVEIANRTSEQTGCFVAPCVHYSFSGGTLPGTINISPQTFSLVLMDICRSLVAQGFKNIVILLGHGGTENTQAAKDAAIMFQRLSPEIVGICLAVVPFWELSPTYMKSLDEGDFHAGRYETSMMLYWKSELVKMDQAALDDEELVGRMRVDPDAYLCKEKAIESDFVITKLTQHPDMHVGVMGNMAGSNSELGKTISDECVGELATLIGKMEGRL
ncbi:MAG: creatininase family protein [Armatimonadota bacterium]